ncbi:hypothetical protein SLA2020_431810, partial [Shorea laevis]
HGTAKRGRRPAKRRGSEKTSNAPQAPRKLPTRQGTHQAQAAEHSKTQNHDRGKKKVVEENGPGRDDPRQSEPGKCHTARSCRAGTQGDGTAASGGGGPK